VRKNWKERFFEISSEKNDYRVLYLEKQEGNELGNFEICGLRPENIEPSDLGSGSVQEYGIKLTSRNGDPSKRVWHMKTDNATEMQKWKDMFSDLCHIAKPPLNANPIVASAFQKALKATRHAYGYFEHYTLDGKESECLGSFISQIVEKQVIRSLYDHTVKNEDEAILASRMQLQERIRPDIEHLWDHLLAKSLNLAATLQPGKMEPIKNAYRESEAAIRAKIKYILDSATVGPALEELNLKVCPPVLESVRFAITQAFGTTLRTVGEAIRGPLSGNPMTVDQVRMQLTDRHSSLRAPVMATLTDLLNALDPVEAFYQYSYSTIDVYYDVFVATRDLALDAAESWNQMLKTSKAQTSFTPWLEAFALETTERHRITCTKIIADMVSNLSDWQTHVVLPSREYAKPIIADVKALPSEVGKLIHINTVVDKVIGDSIQATVGTIVSDALGPDQAKDFMKIAERVIAR
jgi:hypothetical protein